MEDITKLIQALTVLVWPALVLYLLLTYRKQLKDIIDSLKGRKWTIEVGGQKLTMEEATKLQTGFIEDLQAQLLELRRRVEGFRVSPDAALAAPPSSPPLTHAVLWVDDNPRNNSYFIDLLQKRGYRVDIAQSTTEGLAKLDRDDYRLVLSDMGRTENGRYNRDAGIMLLEEARKHDARAPFVFFCSTEAAGHFRERAKELGARAITGSTTELRALLDELAPGRTSGA